MTNLDSILKSRDITLPTKIHLVKVMVFFSTHVWMWELDCKESWALKYWCFWTMVLKKTLESPLDFKEIQPVNPKGNQSWIFIRRTDAVIETPILWLPNVTNWPIWCWERLKVGGEGDNRGWDDWTASLTQWTWIWVNSGSWWTGRPRMLQPWDHRFEHDWAIELNWTEFILTLEYLSS